MRRRRSLLAVALALVAADLVLIGTGTLSPAVGAAPGRLRVAEPVTTTAPATTTSSSSTSTSTTTAPPSPTTPATVAAASVDPSAAAPSCGASACVTLDGTVGIGAADHAASGLNILPGPSTDTSRMRALDTTMYRSTVPVASASTYDWRTWDAASATGARTTLILSDLWAQQFPGGRPATPWSNWARYTDWVRSTVTHILMSGRRVDYWDIYNEPGWYDYYSRADFEAETVDDLLQQFLVTYQAIRAVDPTAAIVGPSLGAIIFSPVPPNATFREPDMTTFLNFAAAHGLQLAAVAWHDNNSPPAYLYADAQKVWAVVRSLPALGHPLMFLDEYGSIRTQPLPGWDVGFLSAITQAGFASAVRSCWDSCTLATLDGLLIDGGSATTSEYFVRSTYARMSGEMVRTTTSDPTVPALASVSADGRHLVALIGRMKGCAVESWCRTVWWPGRTPESPEAVQVRVVLPWSAPNVHIDLSYEPFAPGTPFPGPITVTPGSPTLSPDGPGRQVLTFTIGSFADGSAYNLTVTPA